MRVLIEPGSALMVDRAARVARELQLDLALVACGQEWRRPDLMRAALTRISDTPGLSRDTGEMVGRILNG